MRSYYDKHLDPEKLPTSEDLEILEVTEQAKGVFDRNLAVKFAPAISELEGLVYPGVADPKITITTKVSTSEILKHDSAVQYALSKNDETLKLPEKYNGLGYQNLISMVFDLMSFRDSWMRVGKAQQGKNTQDIIEPLHLVLVEEPEAHLHMQVQQVFIRKAYSVLRNHEFLLKCAKAESKHIWFCCNRKYSRCIQTKFTDLQYESYIGKCEKLGEMLCGYPNQIIGDNGNLVNRLFVIEKTFKNRAEAMEDMAQFQKTKTLTFQRFFAEILNDIFGDS